MSHTPGPWIIRPADYENIYIDAPAGTVAEISLKGDSQDNALLIAAAPDLLNAAFLALEEIDQWVGVMGCEDPRTAEVIRALEEATKMATEQPDNGTQRTG